MTCPGSVSLASTVVDAGGDAADQGTACHKMMEAYLKHTTPVASWKGKTILVVNEEQSTTNEVPVTDEMIGWVEQAVAWIDVYMELHPQANLFSEERLHVGRAFGCPDELWGTADVLISSDEELVIADLKAGYGEVEASGNLQLLLYAIGAMTEYGWAHPQVRLVILQPRIGDGVKEEVYTARELLDYQKRFAPKVKAALQPEAALVPSEDGCRWCPAAGICPELQKRTLALAKAEFTVENRTITKSEMLTLLAHRERITTALKAVERHAVKLLQSGVPLEGWKLVESEKRRAWKDEDEADLILADLGYTENDLYKKTFITPPQAEKLVGKATAAKLAYLIEKPKGESTLAPADDPRPAVSPEFTPVEES
jgi:hypothetical protein